MTKKAIALNIGLLLTGLGAGYAAGYIFTVKKLEKWANNEIQSVKDVYSNDAEVRDAQRKEGAFSTPEGAAEVLIENFTPEVNEDIRQQGRDSVSRMLMDNGYAPLNGIDPASDNDNGEVFISKGLLPDPSNDEYEEDDDDDDDQDPNLFTQGEPDGYPVDETIITGEIIVQSIWDNSSNADENEILSGDELDSDGFVVKRHPDKPYVISVDEYMEGDTHEDSKLSLLYFEEDSQLVDDRETIVPNVEEVVGENNMHKFGIGSKDRNTVYIRNERFKSDYEVIRDKRSYSEVILGIKPERETLSPRKMRDNDE